MCPHQGFKSGGFNPKRRTPTSASSCQRFTTPMARKVDSYEAGFLVHDRRSSRLHKSPYSRRSTGAAPPVFFPARPTATPSNASNATIGGRMNWSLAGVADNLTALWVMAFQKGNTLAARVRPVRRLPELRRPEDQGPDPSKVVVWGHLLPGFGHPDRSRSPTSTTRITISTTCPTRALVQTPETTLFNGPIAQLALAATGPSHLRAGIYSTSITSGGPSAGNSLAHGHRLPGSRIVDIRDATSSRDDRNCPRSPGSASPGPFFGERRRVRSRSARSPTARVITPARSP